MKVVLVEDEEPTLKLMNIFINRNKYVEVIGGFTDSREALASISKLMPDAVFADIEMPHINGMDFARLVKKIDDNIKIVFVTAHDKYALEAFKVNAVNYILKPITETELNTTVNRLLKISKKEKGYEECKKNSIFCFGQFEVHGSLKSGIVRWQTSKVREMFAYFVCRRGREIDKWNLCDMLWPDFTPENAEHSLYSTIYRLRKVLKTIGINNIVYCKNGKYNVDFSGFRCDMWEFEDFIKKNTCVNDENIHKYNDIMRLYDGMLFGNEDYIWAGDLNEKLTRYYLSGLKNMAAYYMKTKMYVKSEKCLKEAILQDPFDENAHELIMRVYFNMGNKAELVAHYKKMKALFKNELNISPRKSIGQLYKNLIANL